jgi:CDGSH-type Zn-finger protein
MSRLVELDAMEPKKLDESDIDPEKGDVAVCQCGLSEDFPFCDGSHRATRTEAEGVRYRYIETDDEVCRRAVEDIVYAEESEDSGTESE